MLSLKNESDDSQNDNRVPKGWFSVIASWKPYRFASNLYIKCILVSIIEIQYYFVWKKSVSNLKNETDESKTTKFRKVKFSAIVSRKPYRFASNLHMKCILVSIIEIKYKISWKKSVWVWKTKAMTVKTTKFRKVNFQS